MNYSAQDSGQIALASMPTHQEQPVSVQSLMEQSQVILRRNDYERETRWSVLAINMISLYNASLSGMEHSTKKQCCAPQEPCLEDDPGKYRIVVQNAPRTGALLISRDYKLRHLFAGCGCFPFLCCCCGWRKFWTRSVVARVEMPRGAKIGEISFVDGWRNLDLTLICRTPKSRSAKKKSHFHIKRLTFRIALPGRKTLLKNVAANNCILHVTGNAKGQKNMGRLEIGTYVSNSVQNTQLTVMFPENPNTFANQEEALKYRGLLLGAGLFVLVEYFEKLDNLNLVSPTKELENTSISPTQPVPGEADVTLNLANNTASVTNIGTAGIYESGLDNRAFNFGESAPAPFTPVLAAQVQQVQAQVEVQPQMSAQAGPQLQEATPAQETVTGTVSAANTIVSENAPIVANENTNVPIISVDIANGNSEQFGNSLAATPTALNEATLMRSNGAIGMTNGNSEQFGNMLAATPTALNEATLMRSNGAIEITNEDFMQLGNTLATILRSLNIATPMRSSEAIGITNTTFGPRNEYAC